MTPDDLKKMYLNEKRRIKTKANKGEDVQRVWGGFGSGERFLVYFSVLGRAGNKRPCTVSPNSWV